MDIENTKQQMRKGVLEYCILSLLNQNESYPSEILKELKSARLIIVEGTLYPLLARLKNEGLLDYRWEESPLGPPRKYYRITEKGKEFLSELRECWKELSASVDKITKKK